MIGTWIGSYKYKSKPVQKLIGFSETGFEMEVQSFDGKNFLGTIKDDIQSGGTSGVGEIQGTVSGDKIEFVKKMPVMSGIFDFLGRKEINRKHRNVYYEGEFSKDRTELHGKWRFKISIIWIGPIPFIGMPTKGSWTMRKIN